MSNQTVSAQNPAFALVGKTILYILLIMTAAYFIVPVLVMALTSVKTLADIRGGNLISWPQEITFDAWWKAWDTACIGVGCGGVKSYFFNSFKMAIPAVVLSTLLGSINGYVLSKWQFKGSNLLFAGLLAGCFIPFQVIILPMAQTLGKMGMANSISGLVFVHVIYGTCFTTLFFRNYYASLPDELIEASMIDGGSFWIIYRHIIAPLSTPIIVVSVIWQFTQIWNDFLFGVIFSAGDAQPMTVALNNLVNTSTGVKEYNVDMSAAIIAAIPTLLVYIVVGKYFVRGMMAGSVKG